MTRTAGGELTERLCWDSQSWSLPQPSWCVFCPLGERPSTPVHLISTLTLILDKCVSLILEQPNLLFHARGDADGESPECYTESIQNEDDQHWWWQQPQLWKTQKVFTVYSHCYLYPGSADSPVWPGSTTSVISSPGRVHLHFLYCNTFPKLPKPSLRFKHSFLPQTLQWISLLVNVNCSS